MLLSQSSSLKTGNWCEPFFGVHLTPSFEKTVIECPSGPNQDAVQRPGRAKAERWLPTVNLCGISSTLDKVRKGPFCRQVQYTPHSTT
jgi:hypothetical protein